MKDIGGELAKAILDAVPIPIFVVEDDLRVVGYNTSAGRMVSSEQAEVVLRRGGEVLGCIHATDVPEGCGRGPHCKTCVVRNSVDASLRGTAVTRKRTRMSLNVNEVPTEMDLLVTAVPFAFQGRRRTLLVLEDVSELSELRSIIPICAKCKKIRDDEEYWSGVETYFTRHLGVDFSHGICPACAKELYPELADEA